MSRLTPGYSEDLESAQQDRSLSSTGSQVLIPAVYATTIRPSSYQDKRIRQGNLKRDWKGEIGHGMGAHSKLNAGAADVPTDHFGRLALLGGCYRPGTCVLHPCVRFKAHHPTTSCCH